MENLPVLRSRRDISIAFSKELPKYLAKHEIDRVLNGYVDRPKDHLLINFLWQTGCRISEALAVKVGDLDLYNNKLRVFTLKRKRRPQRILHLKDGLKADLALHIASGRLDSSENIFSFTRQRAFQIVQSAVLSAGFSKELAHPHTLRHTFAVHCLLQGVPITTLQRWLGHSNIANTLIYSQVIGADTLHVFNKVTF